MSVNKSLVYLKCVGGEVTNAASLAPKCGPLGIPPKKVGEDIQKATGDWKGIKIQVEVMVMNRVCTVSVLPSASALIMKGLKEPPRDRKKVKNVVHNGNLTLDQVLGIAKTMAHRTYAKTFGAGVREILGTCSSIGCTVDKKPAMEISQGIASGEIEVNAP
jgi:large subunit ribosomal protein L12e